MKRSNPRGCSRIHEMAVSKGFISHAIKQKVIGGSTDSPLTVSEAGLGIMTFGEQTNEEAYSMLSFARCRILGRWLASGVKRESICIATKVCGRSSTLDWIPSARLNPMEALAIAGPHSKKESPRVDRKSIRDAAEGELSRLRTDYIDVLQIHWPDRAVPLFGRVQYRPDQHHPSSAADYTPFEEQVEAMGSLIQEGKIRHWGLSNETSYGVMKMVEAAMALGVQSPVTIQNNYSLIQRGFEGDLAEVCAHSNISLWPWSPLAGGALTGKYLHGKPPGSRFQRWEARYQRFNTTRVTRAVQHYCDLASSYGLTCAELSLAFLRSRWFISSTLVGAVSLDQLKANLQVFHEGITLSDETLRKIDEIHVDLRNPALED